jgi:hypothetical protein
MDGITAGEPVWRIHAQCESGACIEVAAVGDVVLIRSSLNPATSVAMTRDEWQGFLIAVKDGDFDYT